ncbi:sensor histidine kinase [Microbacterium paludicola]|uniref:sensor histidine kinase n=1 Tax=Microbacterium paludicola TaxID=300019 RepID=UPI0011A1A126|nr:histidine kinase [Microbacterium paludicola]
MAFGRSTREEPGILRLTRGGALSTLERVAILVIIGGLIAVDTFGIVLGTGADLLTSLVSIATTAVFALYLWSPVVATLALGIVFGVSFLADSASEFLLAAAVAAGMVMRLGRTALILFYAGGFLLAVALVAYGDARVPAGVGIYLIIATVSGVIGFALRVALDRGRVLEEQLAERAEREREAVLAERRWIAGELHDSIAHHLTVISLHVQMLDDAEMSRRSQEAIGAAAKKAMADLRFVIELAADDGPRSAGVQTGDLAAAVDEASGEFEAAGHVVRRDGDLRDERLPRIAEIIFARIVRESATNVLKYAGAGEVGIRLDVDDQAAELTVSSPLPTEPRRELSSSRTGLNRMAERVVGASGEFSAGAVDGRWTVSARLPIT